MQSVDNMQYELCLELARGLKAVKKHCLKNNPMITMLADYMYKYQDKNLERLNELVEPLLSVNTGGQTDRPIELTPQTILEGEILEKEIAPWISEIRKTLFGKDDIPFPDQDSALDWMREYAISEQDAEDEYQKALERSDDGEETFRLYWMEGLCFLPDTPPVILRDKTLEIAQTTGSNQFSLVMHVLANTRLICAKWELSLGHTVQLLPSGKKTNVSSVTIRFGNILNFEDMRKIYHEIKRRWKFQKTKQLNAKHLELYRLVNEKEIPHKGKVAFWKGIMEDWNRTHPKVEYHHWKGVSAAYSRIIKNVGRKFQEGGTK